jgi:hypothetical protein
MTKGTAAANDWNNLVMYWGDDNLNLYARANSTIYLRVNNDPRFWANNSECYAYGQIRSAYVKSDGGIYGAGTIETWGGSSGVLYGSRNNYYSYMIYSQWGELYIYSYEANTESHRFRNYGGAARRDSYSYWDGWSDINMKTDIVDANLDMCYENIKNMNLKRFRYKDEIESIDKHDKYRLGFIAQDLQEIFPKSVRENKIKEGKFLSLNLDQLNYTLYGAVQKIMEKIENNQKRGSVILVNGVATVTIDSTKLGANPQLFLQPQMTFDRVMGQIVGNQINIICENTQSTATVNWLIVSG